MRRPASAAMPRGRYSVVCAALGLEFREAMDGAGVRLGRSVEVAYLAGSPAEAVEVVQQLSRLLPIRRLHIDTTGITDVSGNATATHHNR